MNAEGTVKDTAQGAGLHRFLRSHKLHGTDEFSSVFAFRRVLRGQFYHLHYRPNGLDTARLGVVVAKKLAKRANVRNLVKRIAREIFRRERATLPACDLIARLQASPAGISRAQLNQDLRTLLTRLPRPSAPPPTS
jgi:ribonuclease P protein component